MQVRNTHTQRKNQNHWFDFRFWIYDFRFYHSEILNFKS